MSNEKRGSAGGIARAIIQKQEAKERIDEYNKNPNLCVYCGSPILASYEQKLRDVKIKKFCDHRCSAKYNNRGCIHNIYGNFISIIDNMSDDEIIDAFYSSKNITDFSHRLGYKHRIRKENKHIFDRLEKLGLDINDLREKRLDMKKITKGELFDGRTNWQSARSAIQKEARKIYQNSDKSKQCIVCSYDKHYEVAHIKAVSEFDDDALVSEINDIDNLIALCPNHHWEYDNNLLNISSA